MRADLKDAYHRRQERLAARLREEGTFAYVLEDFEGLRSSSLRWLSGQPTDAILVIFATGRTVLVPWDVNLAGERAAVDRIVPYGDFQRSYKEAVAAVLREGGLSAGARVEFPSRTSHLRREELRSELAGAEVVVRADGIDTVVAKMRLLKDATELAAIERAAGITNAVIDEVERELRGSPPGSVTEVAVAHRVEREALERGAEGMGFETLVAGPGRSWGIHPFPTYTGGSFGGPGLSILDFGVKVDGYTTDVTVTIARGPLAERQVQMIALVQRAYDAAAAATQPGVPPRGPAQAADAIFAEAGWKMPHALGHGIGLDAHEGPGINTRQDNTDPEIRPGMVFTIEPGLYDPDLGGARLENDVLVDERGARIITASRIVRLD